jgi:hypothetical protein
MNDVKSKFRSIAVSFFLAVSIMAVCSLFIVVFLFATRNVFMPDTKNPLPKEVVIDICVSLSSLEEPICQSDKPIYVSDLYPIVSNVLDKKDVTYEDVQLKLGKYQSKLEPLEEMSNGKTNFASRYDLDSDGVTDISFFFYGTYEDSSLMKIIYNRGEGF